MLWIFFVYVEGKLGNSIPYKHKLTTYENYTKEDPNDCLFNQHGMQKFSMAKDFQKRTKHVGTFTAEGE